MKKLGFLILGAVVAVCVSGCSAGFNGDVAGSGPVQGVGFGGLVHGGQQPVVGAAIQLYAASTAGYGAAATPLLTTAVTSGVGGNFSIASDFTCPSSTTQVYLTATGGNPGLTPSTATNPQLAMMTAVGACGNLVPGSFFQINEATTVAAVWALSPFLVDAAHVGTSSTNVLGLVNAFASAAELVNVTAGQAPGNLPSGASGPTGRLNTMSNILAACINTTGGVSGDGSACGKLMLYATPSGGTAPTDTLAASKNIASEPGMSTSNLFTLVGSSPPFQPTLDGVPDDFAMSITLIDNSRFFFPTDIAIDASGNAWITSWYSGINNTGTGFIAEFANDGQMLSPTGGFTASQGYEPFSLAIDQSGNVWWENYKNASCFTVYACGGLGEMTANGSAISPAGGFTTGGMGAGGVVGVAPNGTVWSSSGDSLAEYEPGVGFLSPNNVTNKAYPGGFCGTPNACSPEVNGLVFDPAGNVWTAPELSGDNNLIILTKTNSTGATQIVSLTGGGLSSGLGNGFHRNLAMDANSNLWIYSGNSVMSEFSDAGVAITDTAGYVTGKGGSSAIAIDGANTVWALNEGLNCWGVVHFTTGGTRISTPTCGYVPPPTDTPDQSGLANSYYSTGYNNFAIDSSGDIWIVGNTGNVYSWIVKMVGVAAPVVTPASVAVKNNQLGARP